MSDFGERGELEQAVLAQGLGEPLGEAVEDHASFLASQDEPGNDVTDCHDGRVAVELRSGWGEVLTARKGPTLR